MEQPEKKQRQEEESGGRFQSTLFDWAEAFMISLTVVILFFVFCARLIGVQGSSMVPTLEEGDQLLVSDIYGELEYGDIVVLTKEQFLNVPIVKRVIATEGDVVDIDFEQGIVSVNGQILDEPYIAEPTYDQADMQFPQTVPEDCIFVLGDNRNASSDSRVASLGMVDTRYVIGKVVVRIFPFDKIGTVS